MNETLKVLETRRSCRNFKPDMIKDEDLKAIIRAGTYAATGMGKQSPIIIAVTDKKTRDAISEENRKIGGWAEGFDPFYGAPVILIVLAIMILPSVISISQTAIQAVPHEYEEASLALGATKTETIFKVTLPAAKSGILASIVLGIGRALGEAMAVMMVAGNVANMPSLFKSVRFLTTAVASEMSYSSGLQRQALFSIALVLFIFILLINIILNFVVKRERK